MIHNASQREPSRAASLIKLGDLAIRSEREDDVHSIYLFGELDLATADIIEQELERVEDTDAASILLDLSGLTFMDSSGIRLLWNAHLRASEDSERLMLLRPPAAVQRALELAGLDDRLPFAD
jgi:anti-sigma B factor antagonist